MKITTMSAAAIIAVSLAVGCRTTGSDDLRAFSGVAINEVAAHDERDDGTTWVELYNTSGNDVDLSGLKLFLYDAYFDGFVLHEFEGTALAPGERMLLSTEDGGLKTGIASDSEFEIRLAKDKSGDCVDSFSNSGLSPQKQLPVAGSYQRLPDGTGPMTRTLVSTRGRENIIMSLDNTKHNAIWLWSTYMNEWTADDAALMKQMKALGYDHVLLNYAAFESKERTKTKNFIEAAADAGLMVHGWIQCFYSNGNWVSPVIDEENRYDQELFDDIIAKANGYIDEWGVQGIHLDYIRFGGTAPNHNPSPEVTAVGAVTEFCRQIREAMDARGEGIILSAALMAENNAAYYYGQDASQMGEYIHVLMPMIYRYQSGGVAYGESWCQSMAKNFAGATDAQVWAGLQTYDYVGTSVHGLDAGTIRSDCDNFIGTGVSGVVLFRYALGTFPDVNDLVLE